MSVLSKEKVKPEVYPESYPTFGILDRTFHNFVFFLWMLTIPIVVFFIPYVTLNLLYMYSPNLALTFTLCYFAWIRIDTEGPKYSRNSEIFKGLFMRNPIWSNLQAYFGSRLVKTATLDPSKKYIMIYHPHGVYALGLTANIMFNRGFSILFPGIRLLAVTLPMNFWFPFWRELVLMCGASSCEKGYVEERINKEQPGCMMALAVGSAEEFRHMKANTMRLVLNKRRGFVKLAYITGSNLVPAIGFGENETALTPEHSFLDPVHAAFKFIFRTSAPLFVGGNFGLPTKLPLTTVIGTPIEVKQKSNPTDRDIDELHARYVKALKELYDEFKDVYHTSRTEDLQIVC